MREKTNSLLCGSANKLVQVVGQFCTTMVSRGEIVRHRVQEYGLSVSRLAERIGISRTQLYLDFANPQMSFDRILAIGKILRHDFSQDFKDLPSGMVTLLNGPPPVSAVQLQECQSRLLDVQSQLITALQELSRYKEKYGSEAA